jgi:demethylmenaquinone methyltransferase/2-methoxy-6-polyprenyl-1,4-benzoquinol methylase
MDARTLPAAVEAAQARAQAAGFTLSCESGVGRMLAVLASGAPAGGRILEMGTGSGVGTAWIVEGIGRRNDVELVSIELDAATHAVAASAAWPAWVRLLQGDVLSLLGGLGSFDLIFADAQGGKWQGLDRTIAAVAPRGVLLVDDMTPQDWWTEDHRRNQEQVRATILGHPDLVAAELAEASGMIVAVRR